MKAANRTENPNREPFHKEPNTSSDGTEPYEPNRKSGSQHVNRKRANRNARTECEPFTLIKEIPFSTKTPPTPDPPRPPRPPRSPPRAAPPRAAPPCHKRSFE